MKEVENKCNGLEKGLFQVCCALLFFNPFQAQMAKQNFSIAKAEWTFCQVGGETTTVKQAKKLSHIYILFYTSIINIIVQKSLKKTQLNTVYGHWSEVKEQGIRITLKHIERGKLSLAGC